MHKKIAIISMLLCMVLPSLQAFASSQWLLSPGDVFVSDKDGSTTEYFTDGKSFGVNVTNSTSYSYEFSDPVDVEKFTMDFNQVSSTNPVLEFFDSKGNSLKTYVVNDSQRKSEVTLPSLVKNVSKVVIDGNSTDSVTIYEFNLFGDFSVQLPYIGYFDHPDSNYTYTGADFSLAIDNDLSTRPGTLFAHVGVFERKIIFNEPIPIESLYIYYGGGTPNFRFFDSNDNVIKSISLEDSPPNTGVYKDVNLNEVSYVTVGKVRSDATIYEFDFVSTPVIVDTTPPGNITSLSFQPGEDNILFNYILPTDEDFSHLKILRDGVVISPKQMSNNFNDTGLEPATTYEYKFISVDEYGNESTGITKEITTKERFIPLKDVSQLNADADYNRVDLSWKLPGSTEFKHVNIYRDELAEEPGFFQQLFAGASVSAAEEPTKIFETNGTYFNDLTVAPETTYEYKLTSQSTTGEETDGITVQATTTEEPAPEMGESGYTITPEGDYLYKWDSPTEGQVKVNIAGTEYKTVDANQGQIIIPKDQMKYTIFGDPDIRLYPVSPYGKEGEPYDSSKLFKDGMMPFGGQDLLKTGMSLLGVVAPLVLLGLSFLLFPKIRKIIYNSFSKWRERRG
jgi:hypothetical protein